MTRLRIAGSTPASPAYYVPAVPLGVVIPVGGFAPYLAEAVDSVLAQDPPPAGGVVGGDAADPPVVADERVRVVRRSRRGGPGAARATGAEALGAEIDLVALCDADDAWEPGR